MKPIRRESNPKLEPIFGRRLTAAQESGVEPAPIVYNDDPKHLGFRCPVHQDQELLWSEYFTFVWCNHCQKDLPTYVCIDFTAKENPAEPWVWAGVQGAIDTYIWGTSDILDRHGVETAPLLETV